MDPFKKNLTKVCLPLSGCQDKRTIITIQEIKTADEIARQDP